MGWSGLSCDCGCGCGCWEVEISGCGFEDAARYAAAATGAAAIDGSESAQEMC